MDGIINFKIYIWSSFKAMADKGKKKGKTKFDSLIESLNVITWKSNAIKEIDNRNGIMSSTFQKISVFDSAAGQICLFLCIYNKLKITEKFKSLTSFYMYIFVVEGMGEREWVTYLCLFFVFVTLPCSSWDSARQFICIAYLHQ